jgi:hypothetical protein
MIFREDSGLREDLGDYRAPDPPGSPDPPRSFRRPAPLITDDLITKSEAIPRLPGFGVPAALADQIRHRRDGQDVPLGQLQRIRRADLARRLMRRGLRRLSRSA